ncbi:hypothetical protein KFK09_022290 [Dendrobium nobile]|uniref:RNase H type-1 domain-containing protein n=1 Tax=Dendrobium nobile TaxID=94219 RepID=A0A8T3AIH4_DENNO|nr:hypothetical protein KFK09_022290 [Dendrobium nobile]
MVDTNIINNVISKIKNLYSCNVINCKTFDNCDIVAVKLGIQLDKGSDVYLDTMVYWVKTKPPFIKLNTDGSVGLAYAGAGGLIRDFQGDIISGFAAPVKRLDVLWAELNALFLGVQLCSKKGYHDVWIELDSNLIVTSILENFIGNAKNFYIFRKIRDILLTLNFRISHIYREGNMCADWLAKKGANLVDYEEIDIVNLDISFKGIRTEEFTRGIRYGFCFWFFFLCYFLSNFAGELS